MTTTDDHVPVWARRGAGESRLAAGAAVLVVIVLQWVLPDRLTLGPSWLLPGLGLLLLCVLAAANPVRINREEVWLRACSLVLTGVLSVATVYSVDRLVFGLIDGEFANNPGLLLGSGGAIWFTNLMVFALWFWEFDRGGPAARAHGRESVPDFMFAQMQNPELADPDWEPQFPDYLYLSFTNAAAFSPTDVMPMSRWAKMLMMLESGISLITGVLVIARAVNVLN